MFEPTNPQIRNSTAEFLIFTNQAKEDGIEVRIQDGTVWLTQKLIATLFSVDRSVVTKHLANIYQEQELEKSSTCAIFAQVQ
ncbi:MAG: cell filamentation protein Fic, partial [Prevotellaceae bacterium]|nr:cell filamentation protein Fic [Prevotellaceae bacterium]